MLFSRCMIARFLTFYELIKIVILVKSLENDVSAS